VFKHHGRKLAAVFAADPNLRREIVSLLDQSRGIPTRVMQRFSDFKDLLKETSLCLLVLALSADDKNQLNSSEEGFERIIQFLPRLRHHHPACQVLLITTSQLNLHQTCQAVVQGVSALIDAKHDDFQQTLAEQIEEALDHYQELQQRKSEQDILPHFSNNGLVGNSDALLNVIEQAKQASRISDAPVVIYGQSGTGKQRLAEIIHEMDEKRQSSNFISVNCAAIAGTLAESELFGHKKGAFTGATQDRLGYFRAANGGTILLDEIGELDLVLQPKILRVAQEGKVMPVGSDKEYPVDVRIIASTHRDLKQMVREGTFRLDLYQRLNVIQLTVPSLKQRKEDIPALFQNFLDKYAHYCRCSITSVDPQVYEVLAQSVDSGNIRELENIVRQILIFKDKGSRIEITDLPRDIIRKTLRGPTGEEQLSVPETTIDALAYGSKGLAEVVDEYERFMLERLLERGVNQTNLAQTLGITRRTLYNKLHKYNLR